MGQVNFKYLQQKIFHLVRFFKLVAVTYMHGIDLKQLQLYIYNFGSRYDYQGRLKLVKFCTVAHDSALCSQKRTLVLRCTCQHGISLEIEYDRKIKAIFETHVVCELGNQVGLIRERNQRTKISCCCHFGLSPAALLVPIISLTKKFEKVKGLYPKILLIFVLFQRLI